MASLARVLGKLLLTSAYMGCVICSLPALLVARKCSQTSYKQGMTSAPKSVQGGFNDSLFSTALNDK
jgi:hypothetical protein